MDDRYIRIYAKDFIEDTEKHPELVSELAKKLKVTSWWLVSALKEGRLFDNGYGGYIIK